MESPCTTQNGAAAKIERLFLHPIFSAGATLVIIITGGLGSIWSQEIRSAFPFEWHLHGSFSWYAAGFWSLAIISSFAFFFRERAVQKSQARAQANLLQNAHDLERLVRTLPPDNFLAVFAELYDSAALAGDLVLDASPKAIELSVLETSIRHILRILATLAQRFDGDHPNSRYAANIMLFHPSKNLAPEEKKRIMHQLAFCDESVSIDHLKGVLELQVNLSTLASDREANPDPGLNPLALPIPQQPMSGLRHKILPGAPFAFVYHEPDFYGDTKKLRKWCEDFGDFTDEIKEKVEKFFAGPQNVDIKSFISIPLFGISREDSPAQRDPIAVLNIHCNRPGLLAEERGPVVQFISIIRPLELILTKMLALREAISALSAKSTD